MPQIAQIALVYQSQWFWLLLVLAGIYFFVGKGIVPKVEATVDQRDATIAADLAAAEAARAEADAAEAQLLANDQAAYGQLLARYRRQVLALVWRMVSDREEAQDLAQEAPYGDGSDEPGGRGRMTSSGHMRARKCITMGSDPRLNSKAR